MTDLFLGMYVLFYTQPFSNVLASIYVEQTFVFNGKRSCR